MRALSTTLLVVLLSVVWLGSAARVAGQATSGRDLGEVIVRVLPAASAEDSSPADPPVEESPVEESPVPGSDTPGLDGDCDHDGTLSVADAQCALDISAGLRATDPVADIDGDGSVTSADARGLIQAAIGRWP